MTTAPLVEASDEEAVRASAPARKSLADRLETHPRLFLAIFTAAYVFGMAAKNARRSFWIDELFTYNLANLPSIGQIWPLIAKGIELNPPLPFWLTWIVHHTLGQGEVLTRLPASVGFWIACLCLFHFVRRRTDALHGFVALLLPLFTFTSTEATWARGYGLLLGFSAAGLLCWQLAADRVKRPLALAGLTLSIAGAVSCHFYALYVAGAIGLGELVRVAARRQIDWPILAALTAGVSPLAFYVPVIVNARRGLSTFWIAPMVEFLYESYADLLGPVTIVLFLFVLLTISSANSSRWLPATVGRHEVVACGTILAMPLVVYLGAVFGWNAFFPRYIQPVVIGFSVMAAVFAYRIGGGDRHFRRTMAALLVWLCFTPWCLWQGFKLFQGPPAATMLKTVNLDVMPNLPLVIDSDTDFMSVYHYASPKLRARLYYIDDPAAAVKYWGCDTGIRSLEIGQTFTDLHLVGYREFTSAHPEFLVVRTRPTSWMIQTLMADGAQVELVDYQKERSTYATEALTFRVQIRGR